MSAACVEGGFSDPVMEAQVAFRALMDATARPGSLCDLPGSLAPPAPLPEGLGAVALTLCDPDTPVWLAPAYDTPEVRGWLAFHCACPLVTEPAESVFAFAPAGADCPPLTAFNSGTQEYPDRSTTLVLAVEALEGGAPLNLEGPGIRSRETLAAAGLPEGFVAQRAENRALFPRGSDLLLVAGLRGCALPRTTRVTAASTGTSTDEGAE
ncbi:phosphonate C-P lyase system protein PhnH [Stappia taiwanensis]|uniref:Phosphonate C-P lyase system protein PhnH n=2 Tax=Stappia taiwanensis TaxID=992267 RepID=A0A838XIZ7_9HYPH|nr:phosphonate C-P lyase system protein PhnH [Stappia taiwanensis]MBA4611309.1 phosphonate C-P lyase system protein PhnH [Stappia taiwanensis]GGE87695.1 carbon-phosphorus lyase subunit PhnH [Stappia taiwanensis]